ncbi:MAG: glycosyltransferase family 4 protein [Actinomycetota bacterium]
MKVALDAGPVLDSPTGVGRYTGELVRCLETRGVVVRRYAVSLRAPTTPEIARWRLPASALQELWRRFDRPIPSSLFGDADVVHATNFVLPPTGGRPGVVTVHDLSFHRTDVFPGGERLRELVPWSLRHAAVVVVPTQAIAGEVSDRYAFPADRIVVTPEGVSPLFFGASPLSEMALGKLGIPGPFILAAGTIEPRKNLPLLLRAWDRIRGDLPGWRLVIAGPRGWGPELPETQGVILLGYVADETLPGLMAAAEIFCYPSVYEGFGLPPLEAMAAGTACVVGRYSAAPEVLGEGAVLFDPADAEALAGELAVLAADRGARSSLALTGRAHAGGFTWEKTAAATISAYEKALADT